MPPTDDQDPFEIPPSDPAPQAGGGFLDDLRSEGEKVVNEEIAGLHAAMERVDRLAESAKDADLDELKNEWQQIQSDLKRALQSGIAAVEEGRIRRFAPAVEEELKVLEIELARKNELIAQLSDTIKRSTKELDEKDRRLREEARALRDRAAELEEEVESLRTRVGQSEGKAAQMRMDLESAMSERDTLERRSLQAEESLLSEKAHHEESLRGLQSDLDEARLKASEGEHARRDVERKVADLEKRLEAAEKARAKADGERLQQSQEAARSAKEGKALTERVATLEAELASRKDRTDKELKRLKRSDARHRAEADGLRARMADARGALEVAVSALEAVPAPGPAPADGDEDQSEGAPSS